MMDFSKIYTKEDIIRQLSDMKIPRNSIVLMHSSLRLIGKTENGAKTVLDAMIEYFAEGGGLFCVPTHTWAYLEKEITLDVNDPKTCLGAFSDFAAADKRGVRSSNTTHSMMVFGERERALDFIKDDARVTSGTAPESCYGKLYREGGYVLLVGVGHNRNTYLHCVEEILDMPNRLAKEPLTVKVKLASGEIVTRKIRPHKTDFTSDVSLRFPKYETAFRYHGAIVDGFIGNAPAQACDARIMKEVMERILQNSEGADPLVDEKSIPQKWYR
ncbi:MAG: AAC(3) family N-acetyltransferase [Clostridia bacterium]|nr:AAC(3) family N-acetyltransferase [Clostridia bacterium]